MTGPTGCIFDGSLDNLNTMTVRTDDGQTAQVPVCDKCAEFATLPKVKQAYLEWLEKQNAVQAAKQQEIDALMAKAKELGLELAIPQPMPQRDNAGVSFPSGPQVLPQNIQESTLPRMGGKVIDGRVADSRHVDTKVSGSVQALGSAVSGGGAEYAIRSDTKASKDLKAGEVAEIATVKGRQGMEIAIPVRRSGPTGETIVSIVDKGGDADLQRRFKGMASKSKDDNQPDFRNGYQVKTVQCPLCRGERMIQGGKKICPKCGGHGQIDLES